MFYIITALVVLFLFFSGVIFGQKLGHWRANQVNKRRERKLTEYIRVLEAGMRLELELDFKKDIHNQLDTNKVKAHIKQLQKEIDEIQD